MKALQHSATCFARTVWPPSVRSFTGSAVLDADDHCLFVNRDTRRGRSGRSSMS